MKIGEEEETIRRQGKSDIEHNKARKESRDNEGRKTKDGRKQQEEEIEIEKRA